MLVGFRNIKRSMGQRAREEGCLSWRAAGLEVTKSSVDFRIIC